jgi:ABC-2 type transport system permease protein
VTRLLPAVVTILSGMIVPLPLFPDWLKRILDALPFSGLVDIPVRFYTGHIPYTMLPIYLLRQIIWSLVLMVFGRWLLSRKMKNIVVQGG